jgi:hypothetical protein
VKGRGAPGGNAAPKVVNLPIRYIGSKYLYKEEDIMCNKLNRLNMEEKFISYEKNRLPRERESRAEEIRKRTHCAIRRCEFLIQFKYEKKSVLKASRKCARIEVRINNACLFFCCDRPVPIGDGADGEVA